MKINDVVLTENLSKNVMLALEEHVSQGIPLSDCIFRPGSDAFREFYRTARQLYAEGKLNLDWEDQELLETDIGEYIRIKNELVPLDVPFVVENTAELAENLEPGRDFSLASKEYKGYVLGGIDDSDEDRRSVYWSIYKHLGDGTYKEVGPVKDPKYNGKYSVSSFSYGPPTDEFIWTVNNFLTKTSETIAEAEYQGKDVQLNKPKRGGPKKFYVYVRNPKTKNVMKVTWGDTSGLSVKSKDPGRVKSFVARHKCKQKNDKTKAGYWACRTPRYKSLGVKGGAWW